MNAYRSIAHVVLAGSLGLTVSCSGPWAQKPMTFVADDGKSTIASFHIAYGKWENLSSKTGEGIQALDITKDRSADADTLLLVFDLDTWITLDSHPTVVAQDGTKYSLYRFFAAKPEPNVGNGGSLVMSDSLGNVKALMIGVAGGPGPKTWVLAFHLPPPSSHVSLNGIEGFSHIEFDLH